MVVSNSVMDWERSVLSCNIEWLVYENMCWISEFVGGYVDVLYVKLDIFSCCCYKFAENF